MNGRLHKQNFFSGFIVSVGNKIQFDSMHIFYSPVCICGIINCQMLQIKSREGYILRYIDMNSQFYEVQQPIVSLQIYIS